MPELAVMAETMRMLPDSPNDTPPDDTPPVQLLQLQDALWRSQAAADQVEQLGRIGRWELDLQSGELTWSPGTYRIFGIDPAQRVTHETTTAFYSEAARRRLQGVVADAVAANRRFDFTLPHTDADGTERWVQTAGEPQTAPDGRRLLIGVVRDVTEERVAEARLRHMATHDKLTGLANRTDFLARLDTALAATVSPQRATPALVLADIDHFDDINDRLGHAAGDAVLIEVARRLAADLGTGEAVARIGSDEFALLLQQTPNARELRRRVRDILGRVEAPFAYHGIGLPLAVSIGACLHPEGGTDAVDMLRSASLALGRVKSTPNGRTCIYDAALGEAVRARARVLVEVREGLDADSFEPYYQPIVDLRTRVVSGWEALVRWRHPARGVLAPAAFLPALEDADLSARIGRLVLDRSLSQVRAWHDAGAPVACVNVNVAESQLRQGSELCNGIVALLDRYRLTPDRLKLEILESAFLGQDTQAIADTLARLRELGIVVALDDFGTGYASLSHIKQFDIGRIKVDQSFVRGLCGNARDAAITRAILELGRTLDIRVVAEGIERPDQLALLRAWGCDAGQGYLFGRPMPAAAVPDFLREWESAGRVLIPD